MKRAKRVPRKIGTDDEQDGAESSEQSEPVVVVKRPNTSKAKKSSAVRTSFATGVAEEDDGATSTIPKRTNLSRQILERNAERLSLRAGDDYGDDSRPSYSADYLAELKSSTPTRPSKATDTSEDVAGDPPSSHELDISSKFGSDALIHPESLEQSRIPTEAEIREKKERRRRLALESKAEDFISLDDHDDGSHQRSLIRPAEELNLRDRYENTRLVPDDEDIAEGFDSFVEDAGRVTLGKKAARDQERQRRKDLAAQIRSAQTGYGFNRDGLSDDEDGGGGEGDDDDDDVDAEEAARNAAYEAAQRRAGAYGVSGDYRRKEREKEERFRRRLQLQPKLRPIPDLKVALGRFGDQVRAKELELQVSRRRLEAVRKEKTELEAEEVRVRELLKEAEEKYALLKKKADEERETKANGTLVEKQTPAQEWGLESLGGVARTPQDEGGRVGLGALGAAREEDEDERAPAARSFGGMAQIPAEDEYASDE